MGLVRETSADSVRTFDAIALLLDKWRDIDQQIHDALAKRIRLDGLTLTVGSFDDGILRPPQHVRRVELTDGYTHVVAELVVENFLEDREGYSNHIASRLVMMFAKERYLIKR